MKRAPSEAVAAAIARSQKTRPNAKSDHIESLRKKAEEARSLQLEIVDLEDVVKGKREKLNAIFAKELPDLMDMAGTDKQGLPADGNMPAMDVVLQPYYSANIAASWDEERRDKAFKWLESQGHGDLIKTDITVSLPKGKKALAKKLLSALKKVDKKVAPMLKESVHGQTLTAWLRDQVENHNHVPSQSELEIIGASVGRIVRLKERKE